LYKYQAKENIQFSEGVQQRISNISVPTVYTTGPEQKAFYLTKCPNKVGASITFKTFFVYIG